MRHGLELWQGGAVEGPLVLFLPGCPDSRWAAVPGDGPARRAGVRLVAVNRPGYGATPPAASTHLTVADQLVEVADDLGAERFGVVGMSIGGTYALACAARHPERIVAVATVACPGDLGRMVPPQHRDGSTADEVSHLEAVREAADVDEAVELLRPEFERWRAGVIRGLGDTVHDVGERRVAEAVACPDGYLRDAAVALRPWTRGTSTRCTRAGTSCCLPWRTATAQARRRTRGHHPCDGAQRGPGAPSSGTARPASTP